MPFFACDRGVITDVTEHGVLVSLSTSVRGLVPLAHMSADEAVAKDHRAYFQRGMGVRAAVRSVDGKRRHLILSLRGDPRGLQASLPKNMTVNVAFSGVTGCGGRSSLTRMHE